MARMESWEKILLALYGEAIHCGSFAEVTATTMEMERREFGWTLYALQMRGLISGCVFQPPKPDAADKIMGVLRDGLMLTPQGFQAAENRFGAMSSTQRLHGIWELLRDTGCSVMASIIYGWIS